MSRSHPVPGLDPSTAAVLGTGIELICSILLAFGLGARIAAVPLLLTAAFLQLTYKRLADHLYWKALLGFVVLRGPGALSLDHFIAPHLARSAIPFGGALRTLAVWLKRYCLPLFSASFACGSPGCSGAFAFRDGSAIWQATGLIACGVLAAGLATRAAALLLAVLTVAAFSEIPALGDPVLRLFLLATFVAHGTGAISLDRLLSGYVQRLCPSLSQIPRWLAGAPRVVIVGAGFGGIAAAQAMRHAWARITLIDRRNYHLFQPLLYQVATATLSPADIALPIRALVRGQQNCQVLMGRVTDVDTHRNEVALGDRRIPFNYLVLATGARHSYFGKDEWEPFAPGLKKIDDATAVRSRILAAFERAEACEDEAERRRLLTFILVGGGPTGVELAGAIAELARQSLRGEFRTTDPTTARVMLIQSASRILPALPESLSGAATRSLQDLGVEVLTNSPSTVSMTAGWTSAIGGSKRGPCCGRPALWPRRRDTGSAPSATPPAAWSSSRTSRCLASPVSSRSAIPLPVTGRMVGRFPDLPPSPSSRDTMLRRSFVRGSRAGGIRSVPLPQPGFDGDDRPQGRRRRSSGH